MADEKTTNTSGGVNLNSEQTDIGGDVTGRDKIVSDSHAVFDQRGQRVKKQTNVAGDYHAGDKSVNTGGGAYIGGNVSVDHGGKFVGRDDYSTTGLSGEEIASLFASIYQELEAKTDLRPNDKKYVKADVQDVEAEVVKGDQADESVLERRLHNILRMAPDILDVIANTVVNPALGAAAILRKVIAKVKQESA